MPSPLGHGRLSVCLIVRNEERNLPGCLECAKLLADEIIVVDTGSKDHTREIAKAAGARVFEFPWCDNFSAARNESLRHALSDWILWMDADDRINEQDAGLIARLKRVSPRNVVYCFQVISVTEKGSQPAFMQMRLFPNRPELRFENRVHESIGRNAVKLGLRVDYTTLTVWHRGYHSEAAVQEKLQRNLRLIELDIADNPLSTPHLYQMAQTYWALGRADESIAQLMRITEIPKEKQQQRFVYEHAPAEIANKLFSLGRLNECMPWAEKALQLNAGNPVALFLKGEILRKNGDLNGARKQFQTLALERIEPHSIPIDIAGYKQRAVDRLKELETAVPPPAAPHG